MSKRGVEFILRLAGGRIAISADSFALPIEFGYGDNEEFLKLFVLTYTKFLCDSPLERNNPKPLSVIMKFFRTLTTTHIRDLIVRFAGYANAILENEYADGLPPIGEDRSTDSSTRVFHEFMLDTPVFKEYHLWLRTGRPDLLTYVLSFLLFGKKLAYVDPDFDAAAFRGWLEVEEKLRTLEFGYSDVESLRIILDCILAPLEPDILAPTFGPGKVAEPGVSHVYDKLSCLTMHRKLRYAFLNQRPFRTIEQGFGLFNSLKQGDDSTDIGWLMFVPKDMTKSRSICKEPNGFMYFQQEVLRWMRSSMERGLISRFVDMTDQSINQRAALHGSLYLSSDTIDLSSASDSVSADLVKKVFPPSFLMYMFATRTSKVRVPDGTIVDIHKFAPMGSAVCFPTQCCLFAAISLYAYLADHHGMTTGSWVPTRSQVLSFLDNNLHRVRTPHTAFTSRYEPPVVFGDDIIVDTRVYNSVTSTLSRLGFSVNRSKSFTGSQTFRESCGIFGFEGLDVTPVMFRLPSFRRGEMNAEIYTSMIGCINNMNAHGYHSVATFLLSCLRSYRLRYPIAFTSSEDGFGIFTLRKHRVETQYLRYNADWQCYEEIQQGIEPRPVVAKVDESQLEQYRYDQWWRSRARGYATPSFGRGLRVRPQETRLAPRWARCEV